MLEGFLIVSYKAVSLRCSQGVCFALPGCSGANPGVKVSWFCAQECHKRKLTSSTLYQRNELANRDAEGQSGCAKNTCWRSLATLQTLCSVDRSSLGPATARKCGPCLILAGRQHPVRLCKADIHCSHVRSDGSGNKPLGPS